MASKVIMKVSGINGQVTLMTDRVVITREGLMNVFTYGFNSKREIPLMAISEVMFKNPTPFAAGHIEFVRSGRSADEKITTKHNTVMFRKLHTAKFEALKEKVFEMLEQSSNRQRQ